jgi:cytochrome bd-type quinol oxidase subunit 2
MNAEVLARIQFGTNLMGYSKFVGDIFCIQLVLLYTIFIYRAFKGKVTIE